MARSPKKLTLDEIKKEYPIHFMVWYNDYEGLKKMLDEGVTGEEVERKDVRGRSPLMLAVTLGHLEAARLLMEKGANLNTVNEQGWNVVQEAVATGDPELVQSVLEWRDYQRYSTRVDGVPQLLHKLKEAPDFYVEMKWEFTSWVPLVSSMCPSDTYKVYKQGSKVRIDTTLLGFDHNKWHRGNTTFIFQGQEEEARMMEVDHDSRQVFCEDMRVIRNTDLQLLQPSQESVTARLTTPIVTTYVDTDKICFERNKSGVWGWRQDKMETVNGRECKVFGASNVELVTKTRSEHLSDQDKSKVKGSRSPLQFLLGIDETQHRPAQQEEYSHSGNPCQISPEEYFSEGVDLEERDIGRPKETTTKIQKFKGTLWLSEDYPLSLPQQIVPIIDLMAISNSHFAKLKHFIEMQLPAGFPVKIEIPLFHVLNARITFGNIFGLDAPVEGVSTAAEETGRLTCIVDDSCFQPPDSYTFLGSESRRQTSNMEEDDDMLQYAIQQSLLQTGHDHDQVDIWEALQAQRPNTPSFSYLPEDEEEKQLQRAIEASLSPSGSAEQLPEDGDLMQALAMSQEEERLRREQLEEDRRREEEMVREALRLSLEDH